MREARAPRPSCSHGLEDSARSRASSPTACTRSANARAGRRKHSATTRSLPLGPRSCGSRRRPASQLRPRWRSEVAATNNERVGQTLGLLAQGLAPFVDRECGLKYGLDWENAVPGDGARSKTDVQFLL